MDDIPQRRPKEVQRVFDRLSHADRTLLKAIERYIKVDEQIGLRPGHHAEMLRRMRQFKTDLDRAIEVIDK